MKIFFNFMLSLSIVLILAGIGFTYKDDITHLYNSIFAPYKNVVAPVNNEYYRDYDFEFVQNTNSFTPMNEQDIMNIFYTILNSGQDSFTFFCPDEYAGCMAKIEEFATNQEILSDINNYVHPFNQFENIETEYDTLGRITMNVKKAYDSNEIKLINSKVDELYGELTNPNWSIYQNIKSVHDYIIKTTKYDSGRSDYGSELYRSDIAYGPLFEGWAVCGGYSDLMQLFLERLNVKSYKVSSEKHVWNAVYYNNSWVNLDLTWDDPVTANGKEYLEYSYFLVDTTTMLNNDTTEHTFNYNSYPELKTY